MKKPATTRTNNNFIVHEGQHVFGLDPADIARRIRDDWLPLMREGHNVLEHPFLPYIEGEAISRLSKESRAEKVGPQLKRGSDEWRQWWAGIAKVHVGESCDGLSPIAAAAATILVSATDLRAALVEQNAQIAALMGMQIVCEAIAAGYSMAVELEATEVAKLPQKLGYGNGAGKDADDYTDLKKQMIAFAKKRFAENPGLRIGDLVDEILQKLNRPEIKTTIANFYNFPTDRMIRDWLKAAKDAGILIIPPEAQKAGRPKGKKN